MATWTDPTVPAGLTIMSREYATALVDDVIFLADAAGALPLNGVAHGAAVAGLEGIPLADGELLTTRYGRTTFIPLPGGSAVHELVLGANLIPHWVEV